MYLESSESNYDNGYIDINIQLKIYNSSTEKMKPDSNQ